MSEADEREQNPPSSSAAAVLLKAAIAAIPEGEERAEQLQMTQAVEHAFSAKQHLAVQGPTGVGKSIAYLIPAILGARSGSRTVIVTSSKALQDQLASVELPFLQQMLIQIGMHVFLNWVCAQGYLFCF